MIRTQVYLPKILYQQVSLIAKRENKAKAQVVREALEEGLEKRNRYSNAGQALLELAELGKKLRLKGPKDLSVNIDKYLYEDE